MRSKIRARYALPAFVVLGAGIAAMFTSPGTARATTPQAGSGPATTAASASYTGSYTSSTTSNGTTSNASGSGSGSSDPITYSTPSSPSQITQGETLFLENCASCHSSQGIPAGGGNPTDGPGVIAGPNLRGLGAATIDFWLSTGRMPLAVNAAQATRKPVRFSQAEILDIVAYVTSLQPSNNDRPGIPSVDTSSANLADGNSLFVLNCAACHTITGSGDALANGAVAPSLHFATASQIAEAIFNRFSRLNKTESAGIEVEIDGSQSMPVSPADLEIMQEIGYNLSACARKQLTPEMAESADRIFSLVGREAMPDYLRDSKKVVYWNVGNPKGNDPKLHRVSRDKIKILVEKLVKEIG